MKIHQIMLWNFFFNSGKFCNKGEFQCSSNGQKKCHPNFYRCDGEPDCDDKSDETNCQCKPIVTNATSVISGRTRVYEKGWGSWRGKKMVPCSYLLNFAQKFRNSTKKGVKIPETPLDYYSVIIFTGVNLIVFHFHHLAFCFKWMLTWVASL